MLNSTIFPPDFKEFIQLLNVHEVQYLITGGYALAIYGHPRYTGDIDFWIASSKQNSDKMITVLSEFGFESLGITSNIFLEPNQVVQLGYPPFRIDILTGIDGVDFTAAYQNKHSLMIDTIPVNFISLDDFIKNKKASGRDQDLVDLKKLDPKKLR